MTSMTLAEVVGARLRKARGERAAVEIAQALGITSATLYRWEAGTIRVPHERWLSVAEVLGQPWFELFDPTLDTSLGTA